MLAGFFDLLALLGSLGLLDGLCLLPLLGGWGLLDEFRAFAFDSSEDLKGLGHPCPLASKPLMHLGGGAHRAGGESSLSFFGRRKDVPRALIRLRVLEKQREIFLGGGMIVFEKEELLASKLLNARACGLLGMHGIRGPHPILHLHRVQQLFDSAHLIFFFHDADAQRGPGRSALHRPKAHARLVG